MGFLEARAAVGDSIKVANRVGLQMRKRRIFFTNLGLKSTGFDTSAFVLVKLG
jgi:hypothetical protein